MNTTSFHLSEINICFGSRFQQKKLLLKVILLLTIPLFRNLILLRNIRSCKSFSLNKTLGALSLSHVFDISRANGLLNDNALSNIFRLFVNGGFDTITSQCSGSYSKKSNPYSIWVLMTEYPFCLRTFTNSLCSVSNGHQIILSFGRNLIISITT